MTRAAENNEMLVSTLPAANRGRVRVEAEMGGLCKIAMGWSSKWHVWRASGSYHRDVGRVACEDNMKRPFQESTPRRRTCCTAAKVYR